MTITSLLYILTKAGSETSRDETRTKSLQEFAKIDPKGSIEEVAKLLRSSSVAICIALILTLGLIGGYSFVQEALNSPWPFSLMIAVTIYLLTTLGRTIKFRSRLERDRAELIVYSKS